ncbi:hypothetical protein FisN_14Hu056 [Fistulifera solaris]|jgi:hypothetical protein|uniref:Potassium channel tetramerisation-type BTB domain-containing protein n=1 Tax=Fistulifera solaris TaxID=1519565 RepID=A0A1Z5K8G6_FISSO|nr:hypothetical protein FisN_14Hu056 [Fistulifera solaris]|eukprot:GAX22442.1 hypothetical protein FisN_14Hu056 [Fistulifera solaris]
MRNDCEKLVRFNVGGTHYDVSYDTLKRCKDSSILLKLASLVSGKWEEGNGNKKSTFIDCDKQPFSIERDGVLFQYALEYLRTGQLCLPPSVSRAAMKEEFEYYDIDVDMTRVKERNDDVHLGDSIIKDLSMILAEKLALQVAAYVEYDFIRRNLPSTAVKVILPTYDYSHLKTHEDLLSERLLARGLEYVSSEFDGTRNWVTAKKAEDNSKSLRK